MHIGSALLAVALLGAAEPDAPAVDPAPGIPAGVVTATAPGAGLLPAPETPPAPHLVWGVLDFKLFPSAGRMAPNGIPYNPLFSVDADINVWLWPRAGLYLFSDARFWGQRGTPGQTHGNFDYTKRELDLTGGLAWNYYGALELRAFGYAYNNLNRGISPFLPAGFNDGSAFENRYYLGAEYARLGQDGFSISRATFVSVGYYPSKSMVGVDGELFSPGFFVRAYLTWDIPGTCCYLYGDVQLICARRAIQPKLLLPDVGLAIVPCASLRTLEFRLGSEFMVDFGPDAVRNNSLPYLAVRLNY